MRLYEARQLDSVDQLRPADGVSQLDPEMKMPAGEVHVSPGRQCMPSRLARAHLDGRTREDLPKRVLQTSILVTDTGSNHVSSDISVSQSGNTTLFGNPRAKWHYSRVSWESTRHPSACSERFGRQIGRQIRGSSPASAFITRPSHSNSSESLPRLAGKTGDEAVVHKRCSVIHVVPRRFA